MINSNDSVLYPLLANTVKLSERLSLMSSARRQFGRYLGVEIVVTSSLIVELASVVVYEHVPTAAKLFIGILAGYRLVTMVLGHISILLLGKGKSTQGKRVHSRLRYLALTGMNFIEVVLLGTIGFLFAKQYWGSTYRGEGVTSLSDALFFNYMLAFSHSTPDVTPVSISARVHHVIISLSGFVLLGVVLSILLAIRPEDEVHEANGILNVTEYWSWRANRYSDNIISTSVKINEYISDLLKSNDSRDCVDIGCGVGATATYLAANGFYVTGVDSNDLMLQVAKSSNRNQLNYVAGDATNLPLPDARNDAAVLKMVLHNIEGPDGWKNAIREAVRILKPGGILIVVEGFPVSAEAETFFKTSLIEIHPRQFFSRKELLNTLTTDNLELYSEQKIEEELNVKAWLGEACASRETRKRLLRMYENMDSEHRKLYKARRIGKNLFITVPITVLCMIKVENDD